MKNLTRIKLLVAVVFALAIAASLVVATKVEAQDPAKPKEPPSSFMPVIEEPFEVVLARDKANKSRVMAAAMK